MKLQKILKVIIAVSPVLFFFSGSIFLSAYYAQFIIDVPTFDATLGSLESSNKEITISHNQQYVDFDGETTYIINPRTHCNQYDIDFNCTDPAPDLCPYISLQPKDRETEEIGFTQNLFNTQATGMLNFPIDETDKWNLSITSPCFENECPADYDLLQNGLPLPQSFKGQTFRCDLEINANEPPPLVKNFLQQNIIFANSPNTTEVSAVLTGVLPPCTKDCNSNVLFFPGLMGSKLYEQDGTEEKELWFATKDASHLKLALDTFGKSIFSTIFTKNDTQKLKDDTEETGIIDEIDLNNLPDPNTYKSFLIDLNKWKEDDKIITDYAFIPYDWRLSLDDIITNGTVSNNNLSYNKSQNFSGSFILKKLEELQKTSRSGKVTIIAHSNGGLVTKALIQKLKDTGNPLYNQIDKVIFVAVPQVGTPDALLPLLHGTEMGPFGYVMYPERSRSLSENMPTIYNLLPSESYFDTIDPGFVEDKLISFEDQPFFQKQTSKYGVYISNAKELQDYILGTDGRNKPSYADTINPNIGNPTLYDQAVDVHQILDSWQPSSDTKVIQIAGWGEETFSGLDYKTLKDVTEHLSYKIRTVIDGDGTVVTPSALWMSDSNSNVERWWVDLKKYNKNNIPDRIHKSILEIYNLRNFIKSKIENSIFTDSDNIIVNNTSTLTSDSSRLHFTLHSPLTLGITNIQGKYSGMDPTTKEIKQEIPDVTYRQIGEVQFISVPSGVDYTLRLQGYKDGFFSLDVEKQTGNKIVDSKLFESVATSSTTIATMNIPQNFEVTDAKLNVDKDGDGNTDIIYPIINVETPSNSNTSGSSSSKDTTSIPTQIVYAPKIETENNTPVVQKIEKLKNIATATKIEKQEIKTTEEVEKPENIPLTASTPTGLGNTWFWYVIILSILILVLLKRFIKF